MSRRSCASCEPIAAQATSPMATPTRSQMPSPIRSSDRSITRTRTSAPPRRRYWWAPANSTCAVVTAVRAGRVALRLQREGVATTTASAAASAVMAKSLRPTGATG